MREVVDNAFLTETEHQLTTFRNENLLLREQLIRAKSKQHAIGPNKKELELEGLVKQLKAKKDRYKG